MIGKYLFTSAILLLSSFPVASSFSFSSESPKRLISTATATPPTTISIAESSRSQFLSTAASGIFLTALLTVPQASQARGRATLEDSYARYAPRIISGGQFYSTDLKTAIGKNDWAAIKRATSDPPPKKKEDRSKVDGGVAERAALAGGFSDARVIVAADLYAAAFSDNSVSPKTKQMKVKVEELREVVNGMNSIARQGLGEETGGGGLFGFGAKKSSQAELAQSIRKLYVTGGNLWNEYVFEANQGLNIKTTRLPYL